MTSIRFSKGNNSVELTTDHHTFQCIKPVTIMHSCYTYQVILHDYIVLGIVSESQTQILPRPIERAEVKFSLIHFHLFSLWFPIVSYSNAFVFFLFLFFFFEPMSF